MGDTEKGSWTSRELGRHINEEQARAAERVGHTPGPWGIANFGARSRPLIHKGDVPIADVSIAWGNNPDANARLIAAAPELLAALTNIALLCESNIENVDGQEVLRLANAAIERTHDASR